MLGLEMMLKSMGFSPEQLQQYGVELKSFAEGMANNMNIIRRDQLRIMEKLGIPINPEGNKNAEDIGRIGNRISEGE